MYYPVRVCFSFLFFWVVIWGGFRVFFGVCVCVCVCMCMWLLYTHRYIETRALTHITYTETER